MRKYLFTAIVIVLGMAAPGHSQLLRPVPRLEPIADTKLLMQGLIDPNFQGLGNRLKERPDAESWGFIRGQALLIGEGANLLMMRPPKTRQAEDAWMRKATEMRIAALALAASAQKKDYFATRTTAANLANACNRCHELFTVKHRVQPLAE